MRGKWAEENQVQLKTFIIFFRNMFNPGRIGVAGKTEITTEITMGITEITIVGSSRGG